ncbi:TrpB-like pyridoxal phosphate-dependent enzyme [Gephyromycinifex aptenodytis]|uniref:TrpB-like pyridoxal phosphate-dependent enzyme n=1 Tax=Gephyromycinifex aptenodytis TaxID=2716227 RepID=UPI001445784D|nr:TrpB-like pyridoxal phosphate-dependent enzyme [Gephyromycinifex aptenodytis]
MSPQDPTQHSDTLVKAVLPESEMPTQWYNIVPDLPEAPPAHLHPGTREPLSVEDMAPIFGRALCEQEFSTERYIDIPQAVQEVYRIWRPSPLMRARRLERALGTSARIYYKYEGTSPIGSHKANSSVPQAYYNSLEGVQRLTTETGAGQWGSALAFACGVFDMECEIWQVRASYDGKPYRRMLMETFGGIVHPSPSDLTEAGQAMLAKDPTTTGSLGMAVSEAVEAAAKSGGSAKYALGSVLNHVVLHQSIIGEEVLRQLPMFGEEQADVVYGCAGGGSNLAGLAFPLLRERLAGRTDTRFVAAEPTACPSLTQGRYEYDHGDVAGLTPLLKMYTLGQDFVPDPIHAGGLRYHGMAPLLSFTHHLGLVDALAVGQQDAFEAGVLFARTEGLVPAPESCHAIAAALADARARTSPQDSAAIVIGLSGHGQLDLPAYSAYLSGSLADTAQ